MHTQSFNSDLIRSASYETAIAVLTIYFVDGRKTSLFDVPHHVAAHMFAIGNPTRFWKDCVRDRYPALLPSWRSIFRRRPAINLDETEFWEEELREDVPASSVG